MPVEKVLKFKTVAYFLNEWDVSDMHLLTHTTVYLYFIKRIHMHVCVADVPRLRKSKTLCIVYFLLDAWSSNLRTRICSLLKMVSQSSKYTMYRPTCNLT